MAITKITKTELLELTSTTGAVRLPSGTTAERPSTNLNAGDFRFNTDDNKVEYYDGSNWFQIDDEGLPAVPSENFNTVIYTGDGGTSRQVTGVGFQADLVWVKRRSATEDNVLFDSVRGVQQQLRSNSDGQQSLKTNALSSFDTDGFTIGANNALNTSGETYVGWSFKAGGNSNTFNIDGTGYGTASAASLDGGQATPSGASINTEGGLGIYKVSTSTAARTMTHGLPSTPQMYIFKATGKSQNWYVSVYDGANWKFGNLNTQSSFNTTTTYIADSSNVVIGAGGSTTEVVYAMCDIPGFQKIGTYTGNNSGGIENQTVETGFEPAFLLIRNITSSSNDWIIVDNKRSLSNPRNRVLEPNKNNAESEQTVNVNFLTNGFELTNGNSDVNDNGAVYLYWAIAADADTTTPTLTNSFKTNLYTGNGATQTIGGHINGAAQFNGSSSTIAFNNPITNASKTSMSFSLWLSFNNLITSSFYGIFGTQVNSQSPPFVLNMYGASEYINASFERYESGNQYYSSSYSSVGAYKYEVGLWYHLACSYDSSTDAVSIYINGAHLQTYTITLQSTGRTMTNLSFLGAYDTLGGNVRQSFNGSIDQVRIYDSTLTASEVLQLYNETSSTANTLNFPTGAGCVAAYPLDTNSNDLSGNYNGTDSNITYSEGPAFKPTFIWMKARQAAATQALQDSVRGTSHFIASNGSDPQYVYSGYGVVSYNNDGFTLTDVASGGYAVNGAPGGAFASSSAYYVGWTWKGAVNLPTINTAGSITSIVSANPASGFSTVKYMGNGGSRQSVGHGLNSAPEYVLFKRLDTSANWFVFVLVSGTYRRFEGLNTTNASTSISYFGATPSTITWSGTTSDFNGNGNSYLMYCFHSVAGFCDIGSYQGNRPTDVQVAVPFQPTWVMIKDSDNNGEGWVMIDSSRGNQLLQAESGGPEVAYTGVTFTATGFTVGNSGLVNSNGATITYLAFKEN